MPAPRKRTTRSTARKSFEVTMEHFSDHNKVTRYNADNEDAALANVYVKNDTIEKLGNPASIKVTIEAA
jgi:hypothetical protein